MANEMYRIGIVGAASLVGKELSDALGESLLATSDVVLLDDEGAEGQMTSSGDEVSFIQRLEPSSLERLDFVFFASDASVTKRHWEDARRAGATILDLTYALEGKKGVLVRSPWVAEALEVLEAGKSHKGKEPDLSTHAVVVAHPAAMMIALAAARLRAKLPLVAVAATVMEPASQHGRAAMDELHQQTVNLLSFQGLPREQYDAQTAFNLLPKLGEAAAVKFAEVGQRIREEYASLVGSRLPSLALHMAQAPVFHGYVVSMLIELAQPATLEQVETALAGEHIDIVSAESDPPSNLSATGQENVMLRVTSGTGGMGLQNRFWLWMAADNLKLIALNAIACALELRKLRPLGKVQ